MALSDFLWIPYRQSVSNLPNRGSSPTHAYTNNTMIFHDTRIPNGFTIFKNMVEHSRNFSDGVLDTLGRKKGKGKKEGKGDQKFSISTVLLSHIIVG